MFEITAKIYNGNVLVKYEVTNRLTNKKNILSVEQVQGLAMSGTLLNAEFNEKTGALTGKAGFDLRTLSRRQEKTQKNKTIDTNCFTGKELMELVEGGASGFRERYSVKKLMHFLCTPCNGKVCALYGLRRTGKTVMMYHAIRQLLDKGHSNVVYITLTEKDSLAALFKQIEMFVKKGIKYIFVDEITALNGFIQSSALLADKYAKIGVHLVLAGTDSYVLELAGQNNLYDRMISINTTYIGYSEYEYLNPGTDILEYIRIGGVLPVDIFYNEQQTKDYISTAISNNIINSLLKANNRKEHQRLLELEQRGLLKKAIEQAISAANEELTVGVITRSYINADLGSGKQLLENIFDIDSTLDTEEVEDRVRYKLSIVKVFDAEISEEYIKELTEFLEEIGVIKMYTRYVGKRKLKVPLFVQPGLRYNQTVALINALSETESFFELPKKVRNQLCDKLIADVEGNLLEHEVLLGSLMRYGAESVEVTQLTYKGKEIDMIVYDKCNADIYEVKRSDKIADWQYRWLIDKEFNQFIEQFFCSNIRKRTVLYLGENEIITVTDGVEICYKNVNTFLKN